MITSRHNQHLKDMQRLRRSKGDRALLEGPHLIGEALASGIELETVLATPELLAADAVRPLLTALPRPPLAVAGHLLDALADSDSPRGIVAAARLPRPGVDVLPRVADGRYLFVERLQDPGNLGALARVAEASGAAGLCLSPGSAHPNHPRALRASAGSLLRLPVAVQVTLEELDRRLAPLSPRWVTLVPRGGESLWERDLEGPLVLALGSEGAGLSDATRARADVEVTVPLAPAVESLNVTVAAAVVLFELRRRYDLTPSART